MQHHAGRVIISTVHPSTMPNALNSTRTLHPVDRLSAHHPEHLTPRHASAPLVHLDFIQAGQQTGCAWPARTSQPLGWARMCELAPMVQDSAVHVRQAVGFGGMHARRRRRCECNVATRRTACVCAASPAADARDTAVLYSSRQAPSAKAPNPKTQPGRASLTHPPCAVLAATPLRSASDDTPPTEPVTGLVAASIEQRPTVAPPVRTFQHQPMDSANTTESWPNVSASKRSKPPREPATPSARGATAHDQLTAGAAPSGRLHHLDTPATSSLPTVCKRAPCTRAPQTLRKLLAPGLDAAGYTGKPTITPETKGRRRSE